MESVDIKLYVYVNSPRVEYIAGVILRDILGLKYSIVTDRRKIGSTPFINYAGERAEGAFNICPEGLLTEEGIRREDPEVVTEDGLVLLFPASGSYDLRFDIFAASFWMITRYEEYRSFTPDRHGRYRAEDSLAFRHGFIRLPVVELWAGRLAVSLIRKFPFLAFRRNRFRNVVTFDIDQAYAYRGKGILRGAAGLVSDLAKGGGLERLRSISGSERDPYDVYDYIEGALRDAGSNAVFFMPFGSWSEFDKNNPSDSRLYRDLVQRISASWETGIHFSYNSGKNGNLIRREMERFRRVTGRSPQISRQHYLILSLPETYRWLEKSGIGYDFSMGYPSQPGFRAGISVPFRFYDLGAGRETGLTVTPFAVMDVSLKDYLKTEVKEAMGIISNISQTLKITGGSFVSIWHNSSLTDREDWEGWREVFRHTLEIESIND